MIFWGTPNLHVMIQHYKINPFSSIKKCICKTYFKFNLSLLKELGNQKQKKTLLYEKHLNMLAIDNFPALIRKFPSGHGLDPAG